ncbi:MAG TPA: UbiX family flavin prenyltransferase [Gemmatimonadota bacterium]
MRSPAPRGTRRGAATRDRGAGADPVVLGVTGASGAIYAVRLLRALLLAGRPVDVIFTEYGLYMIKLELGLSSVTAGNLEALREHLDVPARAWEGVRVFRNHDLAAPPASGSSRFAGVAVCPCSMKNLAAIAHGLSETLLQRAADVALKEKRPLVVVPRETPLNAIHLGNMARLARAGGTIVPAMPAFYQRPRTFDDLGDFIAARVLDHLGIPNDLVPRWEAARRSARAEDRAGDGPATPRPARPRP